ncbi:MAG: NAD(P)H-dependent glycerol-3-phosphate dehydrogenase [Planctomycetota bacterium]
MSVNFHDFYGMDGGLPMSGDRNKCLARDYKKVAVIGCGGWGTALGVLLEGVGHDVTIWGVDEAYMRQMRELHANPRYLEGVEIPDSVSLTGDMGQSLEDADMAVMATPTLYIRDVCERMKEFLKPEQAVVNVAKGIEEGSLLTGSQVVQDVCGDDILLAGLYGPSHAEEVAKQQPTTVVATSSTADLAREVQHTFMCPTFRVYTNTDVIGVELGAALKNVIAIAAGVCDGLGYGDNAKSALLTRGLAEIRRLGVALGGRPATFAGLTGLGDLITTCVSPHGRNRSVGERIGRGETLEEILEGMEKVAEGVRTTRSACELASTHDVEMPITRQVYAMLFGGKDPQKAGRDLMMRDPRPELDETL